jgi:hypothetical protein
MPFKINDRVRYTGRATFRAAFAANNVAAIRKFGGAANIVHGPVPLPLQDGEVLCYTIVFDDAEQWLVRADDLEALAPE